MSRVPTAPRAHRRARRHRDSGAPPRDCSVGSGPVRRPRYRSRHRNGLWDRTGRWTTDRAIRIRRFLPISSAPAIRQKGYDYLINGGYITCGIPRRSAPRRRADGPASPGRTGDNASLPYYWSAATSHEGVRVVSANCLSCHAGRINGQLVVGLGAADATSRRPAAARRRSRVVSSPTRPRRPSGSASAIASRRSPTTRARSTIGVNPADSFTAVLFAHRDPATLAWSDEPLLDAAAERRHSRRHAAVVAHEQEARDVLHGGGPRRSRAHHDGRVAAVHRHRRRSAGRSTRPSSTCARRSRRRDSRRSGRSRSTRSSRPQGKTVFDATCSRCHGTYGDGGDYPNQLVPLDDVGTDPTLAQRRDAVRGALRRVVRARRSGARRRGSSRARATSRRRSTASGRPRRTSTMARCRRSTALLDSTKRPTYWTRTFDSTDYDPAARRLEVHEARSRPGRRADRTKRA